MQSFSDTGTPHSIDQVRRKKLVQNDDEISGLLKSYEITFMYGTLVAEKLSWMVASMFGASELR